MSHAATTPKCRSGKVQFPTQGRALNALRHIAIDNAQAAATVGDCPHGTYRCPHCHNWHLTRGGGTIGINAVLGGQP